MVILILIIVFIHFEFLNWFFTFLSVKSFFCIFLVAFSSYLSFCNFILLKNSKSHIKGAKCYFWLLYVFFKYFQFLNSFFMFFNIYLIFKIFGESFCIYLSLVVLIINGSIPIAAILIEFLNCILSINILYIDNLSWKFDDFGSCSVLLWN